MKIRYTILFCLSLIFSNLIVNAQSFAPMGATWHYDVRYAFDGDINYTKFTVVDDTTINGKLCSIISKSHTIQCLDEETIEIVYSSNDSVFHYVQEQKIFSLLYDFNANKGDTWQVYRSNLNGGLDTIDVEVTMVTNTTINNAVLKSMDVTYNEWHGTTNSTIIQGIGDTRYMIPWFPSGAICDIDYPNGLRCYEDASVGEYSTGLADSCTYTFDWTGINELNGSQAVQIYPNPSSNRLYVKSEIITNGKIEVYNNIHQRIYRSDFSLGHTVNTSDFPTGMYYVKLIQDQKLVNTRFVKE